jgi:hypothetical protein
VSDPGALTGTTVGEIKKVVASHKSGICAIQWIPKDFEVEKRGLHHTIPNKSTYLIIFRFIIKVMESNINLSHWVRMVKS